MSFVSAFDARSQARGLLPTAPGAKKFVHSTQNPSLGLMGVLTIHFSGMTELDKVSPDHARILQPGNVGTLMQFIGSIFSSMDRIRIRILLFARDHIYTLISYKQAHY